MQRLYRSSVQSLQSVQAPALQSCALMVLGDTAAQLTIERRPWRDMDVRRTLGFGALGLCVLGPSLRLWYGLLDRLFPRAAMAAGAAAPVRARVACRKVLLDQLMFAPAAIACLLCLTGAVDGKTMVQVKESLQHNYADILVANYKVWPAVMLVNFAMVPLRYQVLVTQSVAVMWNTYFSWKAHCTHNTE